MSRRVVGRRASDCLNIPLASPWPLYTFGSRRNGHRRRRRSYTSTRRIYILTGEFAPVFMLLEFMAATSWTMRNGLMDTIVTSLVQHHHAIALSLNIMSGIMERIDFVVLRRRVFPRRVMAVFPSTSLATIREWPFHAALLRDIMPLLTLGLALKQATPRGVPWLRLPAYPAIEVEARGALLHIVAVRSLCGLRLCVSCLVTTFPSHYAVALRVG